MYIHVYIEQEGDSNVTEVKLIIWSIVMNVKYI